MTSATDSSPTTALADLRQRLQHLRHLLRDDTAPDHGTHSPMIREDIDTAAPARGNAEAASGPSTAFGSGSGEESLPTKQRKTRVEEDGGQRQAGNGGQATAQDVRQSMDFLLGFASRPQNLLSPQDRRLALDMLSVLLPQAGDCLCELLMERLLVMEAPPRALLQAVLEHATPQDRQRLAREARLPDDLLQELARQQDMAILEGIVERRHLPACATWELARHAPAKILHRMLRNGGAVMTETSWWHLLQRAREDDSLHTPLATRADLPRHVALELFWHVGTDQRRHIISRSASDSRQMETLLTHAGMNRLPRDVDFLANLHVVMGILSEGNWQQAASRLADETGLTTQLCQRLLRDGGGEALAVLLKAHGVSTRDFVTLLQSMQKHCMARHWPFLARAAQVESLYGIISINRARLMLLYWNWRCRGIGPYRHLQEGCA